MVGNLESRVNSREGLPLSKYEVRRIVDSYSLFDGNSSEASRKLKHNAITIRKYWNKARLKAKGVGIGGASLPENEVEKIVKAYDVFDGNASEASSQLGYHNKTIIKYWGKEGLKARGIGGRGVQLSEKEIEKIVDSYDTFDGNASEASRKLKHNAITIRKYWNKADLESRGSRFSQDEVDKIIDSHVIFNGNAAKAARQLKYAPVTIKKYWNEKGLKANEDSSYREFETPLDFFRSNKKYHGLTRYELSLKDPGLYRTLLRHGQLEEAIPKKRKGHGGGRPRKTSS